MSKPNSYKDTNMSSLLCLDIGNSGIKWAIFQQDSWSELNNLNPNNVEFLPELLNSLEVAPQKILISSVVKHTEQKLRKLKLKPPLFFAAVHQIAREVLAYDTPETLGIDRYLACLGAWIQSNERGRGVVVIDAGTACTIDVMDANGVYQGGVIMPGLSLFEQGLKKFTKALPEVERDIPDSYPGKSTQECLKWGITGSFVGSIQFHLNRIAENIEYTDWYVTGGDARVLAQNISRSYQLTVDHYLVMKGLVHHYKSVNKNDV